MKHQDHFDFRRRRETHRDLLVVIGVGLLCLLVAASLCLWIKNAPG
jgi:hypothetical protein